MNRSVKEDYMKLKDDFLIQTIDDTQFMVPLGGRPFSGMVRSNKTAAFIVDALREETTEEGIVDAMCARYDAPREVIAADVRAILNKLRSIQALEE